MQEKAQRLDRFLASQNICSRREAPKFIKSGRIKVDGISSVKPDTKIVPGFTTVKVDGELVEYHQHLYIMMNKPAGVLSATEDRKGETVLDILPEKWQRRGLFPAGRLDKDTTGLLIITDDGDFAHNMLSPKKHVYKLYQANTEREITPEDIKHFAEGVAEGGVEFAPAELWQEVIAGEKYAFVRIREGKFHQVKRMFTATDNVVLTLKRVKIGELALDETLASGECRLLTDTEKNKIFM